MNKSAGEIRLFYLHRHHASLLLVKNKSVESAININECIASMGTVYLDKAVGQSGFVRPVLGNYKNGPSGQAVEVKGTCTLVRTAEHFFAVTATHVLDNAWESRPYIPDKAGKPFALGSMLWQDFIDPVHGEGYDLAWALLDPQRHRRLGLDNAAPMLCPHLMDDEAVWALAGFHLKKNRVNHLTSGQYRPSIYRTMSDAPRPQPLAPYSKPTYERKNTVKLPFDRYKFTENREPSLKPRGLSGGPGIHLGDLNQCLSETMSDSPGVFGFLISQSDDDGTVCFASADMLKDLSDSQINDARQEEARLRADQARV